MFAIGLFSIFFYFPSSFAQFSSQLFNKNYKLLFSKHYENEEDTAKLLLMKACLSNLEDCANGMILKKVTKEITPHSGMLQKFTLVLFIYC